MTTGVSSNEVERDVSSAPTDAPARREGALRAGLVWLFRRVVGLYFREIAETGELPAKDTRARVFIANHTNGLVDPILVLTHAPCAISPIAKSTLWKVPGLRFLLDEIGAVPILRRRDDPNKKASANDEVMRAIGEGLARGRNVLIFPEGTSHNEPHLLDLKTGAARMLAEAKQRGAKDLTFQAVALEFDDRTAFRSRCLMVFGPVRSVADVDRRGEEFVAEITERMRADLSELVVEGRTWKERVLIARVVEMIANGEGTEADRDDARSLERWNSIGRQVEAASKVLAAAAEGDARRIEVAIDRYYALLAEEGLTDAEVAFEGKVSDASLAERAAMLAILPLAAAGAALYALPYFVPRYIASKAASDPDEVSTYKIAASLLVYPIWAAALAGAGFALLPRGLATGFAAVTIGSPFAALAWLDKTPELRRALRFRRTKDRRADLRSARAEAMAAIRAARERLGL